MIDDASPATRSSAGRDPHPPRSGRRTILFVLLLAGVVGAVAGWLSHEAGSNLPSAILTGGGAFAGAAGLLLAIARHNEVG
jgi:hypothetical protein